MARINGTADPSHVAVAAGLGEQTPILAAILAELRSEVLQVAVADTQHQELVLDKFPVVGSKRAIATRTSQGNDSLSVSTATYSAPISQLVCAGDTARLGGTIVNSGTNPVILYLTNRLVPVVGVAALYLASGGSWDFRLGNVLWCGNVSAVAQTASSTLTVATV